MPPRHSDTRPPPGRSLRLAACAVFGVLLAPEALAQLDTVTINTSEGRFSIQLFDFPDVVEFGEHFRNTRWHLNNAFFHRGDKQRFCDESYCFECFCDVDEELCEDESGGSDPNDNICDPVANPDPFWIVIDQTVPAPYLEAGRFFLDDNYAIDEHPDSLPSDLQDILPTFSNVAFTVAYVRDPVTKNLTSDWIINLEHNTELDDPFPDDPQADFSNAYLVFGVVSSGLTVLDAIAAQKTYDATKDPDVLASMAPSPEELEQVPVFESFVPVPDDTDKFIDPCNPDDAEYEACLRPACEVVSLDEQTCEDPRCLEVVPLTEQELADIEAGLPVERFCATPVLPAFPVMIPEPRSILGQVGAMLALVGLYRHRRRTSR